MANYMINANAQKDKPVKFQIWVSMLNMFIFCKLIKSSHTI